MNKIIEPFNSLTGFTPVNATIELTQWEQYLTEYANSLLVKFAGAGTVTKTLSIDVSDIDYLVFHCAEIDGPRTRARIIGDFDYKVTFDAGDPVYFSAVSEFSPVYIDVSGVDIITNLIIERISDTGCSFVISNMVGAYDELPLDIFNAIKDKIQSNIVNTTYSAGTLTGAAGDQTVTITPGDWIEKSSMILIDDGVNSEKHRVKSIDDGVIVFDTYEDGAALVNSYTDANVYIYIPVFFNSLLDIVVPGITVWLNEITDTPQASETTKRIFNQTDSGYIEQLEGSTTTFNMLIDVEAYHPQILHELSGKVRKFLQQGFLWINGTKFIFEWQDNNVFSIDNTYSDIDIIPKIQYNLNIIIKEQSTWTKKSASPLTTISVSTSPNQ